MRILFITHYFYPEGNAPATRVHQLTRRWAAAGHDVTVITAVPNVPTGVVYEGYRNNWRQAEQVDRVRVVRVWTYLAANSGKLRRIVSYLSFMVTAVLAGVRETRPEVVIATSPQFFCGWAGRIVAILRRLPFILEVRDLWPESIVAVGAMRRSPVIRMLEWLERRLYAGASGIITVGEGYRHGLLDRGVVNERIRILPNGVDLSTFRPDTEGTPIRSKFDIGDRFTCAFVGTLGMAAGLDVVVKAAQILKKQGRDGIRFLLVGEGAERKRLEDIADKEGLTSIIFTGRLSKERVPEVIAAADVCLVHLRRTELFETVMPSKIFEAAAMRRPIILGVAGEAARWLAEADAGITIEPEDEAELLAAVDRLAADSGLRNVLGGNGRAFVEQHHDYELLAAQYVGQLSYFLNAHQAR